MRKIFCLCLLFSIVACTNPEDNATGKTTTDTAGYNENNTLNSMPGPTSPDSITKAGIDRSHTDTGKKNP